MTAKIRILNHWEIQKSWFYNDGNTFANASAGTIWNIFLWEKYLKIQNLNWAESSENTAAILKILSILLV